MKAMYGEANGTITSYQHYRPGQQGRGRRSFLAGSTCQADFLAPGLAPRPRFDYYAAQPGGG